MQLRERAKELSGRVAKQCVISPAAYLIPGPVRQLVADLAGFIIVLAEHLEILEAAEAERSKRERGS